MSRPAILGGEPVRGPSRSWPVWPAAGSRERELVLEVLAGKAWAYDGPMETAFTEAFCRYLGTRHGFCVSSGTAALELALEAVGIGPGDEVIVPGFTWLATASSVVARGATVVFVDIEPDTYQLDARRVEEAVTARTRALIPVHLYSRIVDMDAIMEIADRHGLTVIEDCAQAHGARWNGRTVGSIGHISCFSFQKGKVLTCGEGGFVATSSPELAERVYGLKNCGRSWEGRPTGVVLGHNQRISEFQAAVLLAQLDRLDEQVRHRARNGELLDEALAGVDGLLPLRRDPRIGLASHYSYICRLEAGGFDGLPVETVRTAMAAEGVPVDSSYGCVYSGELWSAAPADRWRVASGRVCEQVDTEILNLHQPLLLAPEEEMADIVAAFRKIRRYAPELAGVATGPRPASSVAAPRG